MQNPDNDETTQVARGQLLIAFIPRQDGDGSWLKERVAEHQNPTAQPSLAVWNNLLDAAAIDLS